MLRFQAERRAARIGRAAFARGLAVEKISRIELHAGLGGPNFQNTAGGGLDNARGQGCPEIRRTPQDKVVVVSTSEFQLLGSYTTGAGPDFAKGCN